MSNALKIAEALDQLSEVGPDASPEEQRLILDSLDPEIRKRVKELYPRRLKLQKAPLEDIPIETVLETFLTEDTHPPALEPGTLLHDNLEKAMRSYSSPHPPYRIIRLFRKGGQFQLYEVKSERGPRNGWVDPTTYILKAKKGPPEDNVIVAELNHFHLALFLNGARELTGPGSPLRYDSTHDLTYYVMPRFDTDLAAYLKLNPPLTFRLELLRILAIFVDCFHASIIHRDIKPSNILIKMYHQLGYPEQVILADFGIAARKSNYHERFTDRRPFPAPAGSEPYRPPESYQPNAHATVFTDTYSFAVTALETLDATKNNLSTLPRDTRQVFRKALSDDPERRFPSCYRLYCEILLSLTTQLPKAAALDLLRTTNRDHRINRKEPQFHNPYFHEF